MQGFMSTETADVRTNRSSSNIVVRCRTPVGWVSPLCPVVDGKRTPARRGGPPLWTKSENRVPLFTRRGQPAGTDGNGRRRPGAGAGGIVAARPGRGRAHGGRVGGSDGARAR